VTHRVSAFFAIGVAGFVLQIVLLHWLSSGWHWPYVLATLVAVESAILHNFFWHERWTWADRRSDARSWDGCFAAASPTAADASGRQSRLC